MAAVLRSPCAACGLLAEDKNSRVCIECEERVAYVRGIGSLCEPVPEDLLPVEGGGEMGKFIKKSEDKENRRAACSTDTACNAADQVERSGKAGVIITEVCEKYGIIPDKLRSETKGNFVSYARAEISHRLQAELNMEPARIATLIGMSGAFSVRQAAKRFLMQEVDKKPDSEWGIAEPMQAEARVDPLLAIGLRNDEIEKIGKIAKAEERTIEAEVRFWIRRELRYTVAVSRELIEGGEECYINPKEKPPNTRPGR